MPWYDAPMDYGYVVGTFIRPLGAPAPTDRAALGTVRFLPHDTRTLAAPPRTVGRIEEEIAMDSAGHVEGWLVTGVYSVFVTYTDGTKRPPFTIQVEDVHTPTSPLDLTTAAPPIPSPETIIVASVAERERAEAAAERAEDAAAEVAPIHIYSDADLKAVTHPGPAILHVAPGGAFTPAIPPNSLIMQAGNIPLALFGEVSIFDYSSVIAGVKVVTFSTVVTPTQFSSQVTTLTAYQNYPTAPSYWTVSDFLPIASNSGSLLRSTGAGGGTFKWVEDTPQSAVFNNTVMLRDAFGRSQVAAPVLTLDIANKSYVDGVQPARSTVPTSATAAGTKGQVAADASFLYVCVATNTWRRVALATW